MADKELAPLEFNAPICNELDFWREVFVARAKLPRTTVGLLTSPQEFQDTVAWADRATLAYRQRYYAPLMPENPKG